VTGSVEIERKFLIGKIPAAIRRGRGVRISQGYFPLRDGKLEIRLRRKGSQHFITFKSGSGAKRGEIEIPISREHFEKLWPFTTDGRIKKRRFKIPYAGVCVEMDVYEGPHRGLITAEVEFNSISQCRRFQPPEWMGQEITDQKAYGNHVLARRGRLPARMKRK
jgi:adenylate cyclase